MRTSPRFWERLASASKGVCAQQYMQNERCVFLPFLKRCKCSTLLLALQKLHSAAARNCQICVADGRLQRSFSQRGGRVKYLFAFYILQVLRILQAECLQYTQLKRSFVYMCACSINNASDTCVLLGLPVFKVARPCRGILSFCSVNHHVKARKNQSWVFSVLCAVTWFFCDLVPGILLRCCCVRRTICASTWKHLSFETPHLNQCSMPQKK